MKQATLFHSTGASPKDFWFPWLGRELESRGYDVWAPELPDTDKPDLRNWLPAALEREYDNESVLVGHSAGGPLILALLEQLASPVKQSILVAGFARLLPEFRGADAILQDSYRWERIRANAGDLIFINSDNDPFGCDDTAGRYMLDNLGGTLIIPSGHGHMGSGDQNQPYKEFPLVLKLIV